MPLLSKWNYNGAIGGIWHVTETIDELRSFLPADYYIDDEVRAYKSESRKIEYLAVRVLLKDIAGCLYRISHSPSGKPFLEGTTMKISISHTRGYVAVMLHPDKETGIDIEYFSDRVKKVAPRFVRDDEMEYISHYDYGELVQRNHLYMLLLIWSGKETLYKIIDYSEVDFKNHLCIYQFGLNLLDDEIYKGWGKMNAKEFKSDKQSDFTLEYLLHADFVCTYCVAY